ncbi:MAG: M1 family aminopeptidase, partial [Bacteroidia bacterium]
RANIDLYPSEQAYHVKAQYELCNPHSTPLNQMWIALDQVAELDSLFGKETSLLQADDAFGMYLVALDPPMQGGESRDIQFQFQSYWSPFAGLTPFNAIVSNGSFMRISRYFPLLGYQTDWEMNGAEDRQKQGLVLHEDLLSLETLSLSDPYENFIQWEAIISTEADQSIVAAGQQIAHWQEGERSFFHFRTPRPIPFRFAVSSARYAERLDSMAGIQYRILHHPAHQSQIKPMLAASQQTIAYCERAFGPYPFGELQIAEVSDFTEGFAATAYPNTLYIRESMGWYADPNDPDGPNRVFLMMAHEIAHQWWGGQLYPEYREGATLLTESLAQYTAYMLYKEAFGEAATQKTLQVEAELYFQDRGFQTESPLLRVGPDQPYVAYQKGAVVLYAIQTLIGEKQLNLALASLLEKHAYPQMPASSLDLLAAILAQSPAEHHSLIRQWFTDVCIEDVDARLIVRIPD